MNHVKRTFAALLSLLVLLSAATISVYAGQPEAPQSQTDWQFSVFGPSTSATKNPAPDLSQAGKVTMKASGGGGKLSSTEEGLSFYYKELEASASFELHAKATVLNFNSAAVDNQKSFGLMIKDKAASGSSAAPSHYVAAGAVDMAMKSFYKRDVWQKNAFSGASAPASGQVYDLSIRKSGSAYRITVNGQSQVVRLDSLFSGKVAVGLYVSRDAEVAFSDFAIVEDLPPKDLQAHTAKTQYLVGEPLDLSTWSVTAVVYGSEETVLLAPDDYILTGYDSSSPGVKTVTVHYKGAEASLDIAVIKLDVLAMETRYYPARTVYYAEDTFDPAGLMVMGQYNNGNYTEIGADKYTFSITGATVTGNVYAFHTPGVQTVTVISTETPAVSTSFEVLVKADALTGLTIAREPARTAYFLGDTLDLDGLIVYAQYGDGSRVRLTEGEYAVSTPDMSSPGVHEVVLTFRGQEVRYSITVKEKSAAGLQITAYPKTTYRLGEPFLPAGLKVSLAYDNGELELLPESAYSLRTEGFDSSQPGLSELAIVPVNPELAPIPLRVTVRDDPQPEWKSIIFGQSTSSARNSVTVVSEGTVELAALESGGKITGDHDGISFYYTELDAERDNFSLSADIKVKAFAKDLPDGQESFGIMARDAIGAPGDSSVFSSNMAAVGGYSGGTANPVGTQLFIRTGVEKPDGTGSKGIQKKMLKQERPSPSNTPYKLTLAKTNSGLSASINDGTSETFFEPDILKVQDSKMYIGFYTARLATIEVSNIRLAVTSAATDAPKVEPPVQPVEPQFDFVSLAQTSSADYLVRVASNVNGTVTIKQGQQALVLDGPVEAGKIYAVPAVLAAEGDTHFSAAFLPDDTQNLSSYGKIVRNFTVTMKSYAPGGSIYASPEGTSAGAGTAESPLDLDTAVAFVKPGQAVIVQDGVYKRSSKLEIKKFNDGTDGALKSLVAAPGAKPVIDFDQKSEGVVLSGNYWHVKGIDFARSAANTKGFTVGGSHNIIEASRFYENGDTGLQISRTDTSNAIADWPSYNLILNSTSFDNRDPSENNADGFAAKLTAGVGNVFRGCISHNNIDDGWDLYTKAGSGAIGAVVIEDSIAYNNGTLTNGTVGKGDKNGFKLGGEGIRVSHVIRNSIAFGNGAYGFTSNSNPGVIVRSNIGFDNASGNLNLTTYTGIDQDFTLDGFISYQKLYTAKDHYPAELVSSSNYLFDGTQSANKAGIVLQDSNFKSLTPALPYIRDTEGNIIRGDFLSFTPPGAGGPAYYPPDSSSDGGKKEPAQVLEGPGGVRLTKEPVPYLSGYEDGTVRPDRPVSREEALSLLYELAVNEDKGAASGTAERFSDVDPSAWSAKAIFYFLEKGLVNGYEDGSFHPGAPITRAELVAILAQFLPAAGTDGLTGGSFTDIAGHWARTAIQKAAEAGLINGYGDGSFGPDRPITRAEAVVILNRVLGRAVDKEKLAAKAGFQDLKPEHWAYWDMLEASR